MGTDNRSANSMCGTPEYLAPEILDKKGHGKAVDWYSLGALMYEMLTGLPPFYTRDREKLFERIRRGELTYPSYVTQEAKELLAGLMIKDPNKRLSGEETKKSKFFSGVDWAAVYNKEIAAPFVPQLREDGDVKYFDKEFTNLPAVNSEARDDGREIGRFE